MTNNTKAQATVLWILAIFITLSSVVYQRKTGPTYPVEGSTTILGTDIEYYFPRSQNTGEQATITLDTGDSSLTAVLKWKRFKSHDEWQYLPFTQAADGLHASLPSQPPAGKIIYFVEISDIASATPMPLLEEATIIRFKGAVPAAVLIPHILFMFAAMLLATRSGLAAYAESDSVSRYVLTTGIFLLLGGLILGPMVQKHAFDAYWTGWPWGTDLTDNKTAVAFLSWALAFWRIKKTGQAKAWVIAAALITLAVYLIPHSAFGSELDYTQLEQ